MIGLDGNDQKDLIGQNIEWLDQMNGHVNICRYCVRRIVFLS